MKIILTSLSFLLLFILLFTNFASAQNCEASADLPNFGCVNAELYRGAQPTEEGIKELARRGVKTIINLRDADKKAYVEEERAHRAGIKFINIPLGNWLAPGDSKIEQIMQILDAPENQPVFVHCKRGADRTGTVVAVYRITHDDWTADKAMDEAKKYRFGWWQFWMKDYIGDYYKKYEKRRTKPDKALINPLIERFSS